MNISNYTQYFPNFPFNLCTTQKEAPHSIARYHIDRPRLTKDGSIIQLYKEDFIHLSKRRLEIVNPSIVGKNGFVLFRFLDSPDSQDTKTMWTAYLIFDLERQSSNDECERLLKTCKFPFLMYLQPNGALTEWRGPINLRALHRALNIRS